MGRPRKPTHLKLVTGTTRKGRETPNEPKPATGRPVMPGHLSKRAAAAWLKVSKMLNALGVLTALDAMALERLCECYAEILEYQATLDAREDPKTGEIGCRTYETTTVAGGRMVRVYPEVALLADADRRFKAYLGDFGLTPATRSKVSGTSPGAGAKESEFG